jgi:hypothetical protein
MSKSFKIAVKQKQEQNNYIEESLSIVDGNSELAIEQEVKDMIMNRVLSIPKERMELGSFDDRVLKKFESKEEEVEEGIKEIESKEEEVEEEIKEIESKEEEVEERINEIESKEEEVEGEIEEEIKKIYEKNILYGKCEVYRSKNIDINRPKGDIIVKVGNIDRSIYVESVEALKDGVNILTMVVENITYYTSKAILPNTEEKKYKRMYSTCESYEKECICFDGEVRNTSVKIPYIIYLDIIDATEMTSYEIEDISLECINTKYILDNGNIIDNKNSLMYNYIESLIEEYKINISLISK